MPPSRCFAVIPAAGHSRRMGTPHKLLLPWHGGTVIDHVLRAWTQSSVQRVIVVARSDDHQLHDACRRWPSVSLVIPQRDPDDMKRSVQLGIERIAAEHEPQAADRWLVAPADLPTLTSELIDQLIAASRDSESIVAPQFGQHRGHPVSFPWSLTRRLFELGPDQGIDQIMADHGVECLDLPAGQRPEDIDTPADYQRLSDRQGPS
jgi:molybdenum cofactor cytidylyltransferase